MRKAVMAVLALCLAVPAARAQQQEDKQAAARREMLQKMQALQQQMRDLERDLARMEPEGRTPMRASTGPMFRMFSRAHLGVVLKADKSSATDSVGALLTGITTGGPGDQAGLKPGDIITTFNGEKLTGDYPAADEDESAPGIKLRDLASDLSDGDTVKVDYRRGQETHRATIVARDLPQSFNFALTTPSPDFRVATGDYMGDVSDALERAQAGVVAAGAAMPALAGTWMYDRWFDMELVALNPDLGDYFGTSTGLLVIHAPRDSSLNLKGGDVILAVDGRTPASQAQLIRILRSYARGEQIHLDIMRQKHRTTVTAKIPEGRRPHDRFDWDGQHDGIMR